MMGHTTHSDILRVTCLSLFSVSVSLLLSWWLYCVEGRGGGGFSRSGDKAEVCCDFFYLRTRAFNSITASSETAAAWINLTP